MPTYAKHVAVNASSGAYVALGTDTNRREITIVATAAIYIVFDAADASTAATMAGAGTNTMMCGTSHTLQLNDVKLSTTWVRAQAASATAASYVWHTP